jgi:hypothetical protein
MEKQKQYTELVENICAFSGIPIKSLELYLGLINSPPTLNGLLQVTEQFHKISNLITAVYLLEKTTEFLDEDDFKRCLAVATAIQEKKADIERHHQQTNIKNHKGIRPYQNLYTSNPVYVCLGISALEPHITERHLLLEAYILVAATILRQRKQHDTYRKKEYQDALLKSCRLARKILLPPRQDTYDDLPTKLPEAAGEYTECIKRTGELLAIIHKLLVYAFSKKRAKTYNKEGKLREFRSITHSINYAVDPELIGKVDSVNIIQPVSMATSRLECNEPLRGIDFLLADSANNDNPMDDMTSGQHKLRKRSWLPSITMHNQRFLHRWEMLSCFELSCFISGVSQLAAEGTCQDRNWRLSRNLELAAVAVTIFLRSLPLSDLKRFYFCDARNPEIAPPGYQYYHDKTGCWIVYPPKLPVDMKLGNAFYSNAEPRKEFFHVSSGTGLEKIIDRYIAEVRPGYYGTRLFSDIEGKYDKPLSEFLSKINKRHDTRLTIKRLEIYIHNLLARQKGGDLTTAMLLTGRRDFLGMPPLHYTAYPVSNLQKMYQECCREVMNSINQEAASNRMECTHTDVDTAYPDLCNETSGTAYRPRRESVRMMIASLQDRMDEIQKMPQDINKLLILHNNIMRYTAILFAFSTGFRAVNSPLLPPSQIDFTTGFAAISDKDGVDYYNARVVWLPLVCIQQYNAYLTHLDHLLPKLELLDTELFHSLRYILDHPLPSDKLPLFFFMTRHAKHKVITPTDIWKEIRRELKYALPPNASRHYLRSNLLEQGCPPEYIAAFMGHWERGEEPWGRYSALSPQSYAATLSKYLVPLLDNDGWKSMQGIQEYW